MSKTEERGEIMWIAGGPHDYPIRLYRNKGDGVAYGVRVRVTPEPEPERFYVDNSCYPIEVRDRPHGAAPIAIFWNPIANHTSVHEKAEAHAAWLNEEAKRQD